MNAKFSRTVLALAAITVSFVGNALGQYQQSRPEHRSGFWFSAGLGYGSLGCQGCTGRTGGLSGNLALGGSLSNKVLLGVSDRKSTRLNSSHPSISYAVFCLKKKKKTKQY